MSKVLSVWNGCELELIRCLGLTNTSNSDYAVERNNKFPMAPTKWLELPAMSAFIFSLEAVGPVSIVL